LLARVLSRTDAERRGRAQTDAGGHSGALAVPPQRRLIHLLVGTVMGVGSAFPELFLRSGHTGADVSADLREVPVVSACRRRPLLHTRSYPHSCSGFSSVGGGVNHGGMFFDAQVPDPASGDPHLMQVETVRAGGPKALT